MNCSMDADQEIRDLKRSLVHEVDALVRHGGANWRRPIAEMVEELKRTRTQAVLFGGTLRSLLIARRYFHRLGRPRDVDVVVKGIDLHDLQERFRTVVARRTRFGGLKVHQKGYQFDV